MEKAQGLSETVHELNLQHWGCSEESEDSTTCEVAPSLTSTGSATLEEGSQAVELGDREKRTLLGCHSAESQNRTSLLHDLLCKEKDNFFFSFRKAHVLVLRTGLARALAPSPAEPVPCCHQVLDQRLACWLPPGAIEQQFARTVRACKKQRPRCSMPSLTTNTEISSKDSMLLILKQSAISAQNAIILPWMLPAPFSDQNITPLVDRIHFQ